MCVFECTGDGCDEPVPGEDPEDVDEDEETSEDTGERIACLFASGDYLLKNRSRASTSSSPLIGNYFKTQINFSKKAEI